VALEKINLLNEVQADIIHLMIPMYGKNEAEVVQFMVTSYIHEHIEKISDVLSYTGCLMELPE